MKRCTLFLLVLSAGLLVYFVGGYWAAIPSLPRTAVKAGLTAILLLVTIALHRRKSLERWRNLSAALLAASSGFLVSWVLADRVLSAWGVATNSVRGVALTKFVESTLIVIPVLVVARLGGLTWSDLFVRRGRAKAWLIVGFSTFFACALLFILQARGEGHPAKQLLAWAPWTLLFALSNGFMEELHFRGLLLRPTETLLGRNTANLCIALVFTLVHAPVTYTPDILPFLVIVFVLALLWGYVIQRTAALWGAVLFHAGADLLVIVGIYEAYGISP